MPVLPRPDSQNFTRFLLSAGVFLVVAAFVLPGLVLRDTDVLTISEGELQEFTPTASDELRRRQGFAQDAGRGAPYVGVGLLGVGLLLIGFGIPRLLRQERNEDERSEMELDKLREELRPQSPRERRDRLTADDEPANGRVGATAPDQKPIPEQGPPPDVQPGQSPGSRSQTYFPQYLRQRAGDELAVLARLSELVPTSYELQTQVKLGGKTPLLLDALFISGRDELPDIVVEIKFAGGSLAKNLKNRIVDAQSLLFEYRQRYRRQTIGWLIVVAEEEPPARSQKAIEETVKASADLMHVSIVTPDALDKLKLPLDPE